ncbi:MAG: hypothetical protein SynsKO_39660 [Synoicihabitans sp.]
MHLLGGAANVAAMPNIIFNLTDYLGWAEVDYNGAKFYETPPIGARRKSGRTFAMSYPGGANCMPS